MASRLEWERKLVLDLSASNRLLSYRRFKSRGLTIHQQNLDALFEQLVEDERTLRFSAGQEARSSLSDQIGESVGTEFAFRQPDPVSADGGSFAPGGPSLVQTPYDDVELQRRLLNTFYSSQRILQERGVNTLFVALGFLNWSEKSTPDSSRRRTAPLVLVPVSLSRSSASARFEVRYSGEDITTNLSLAEKLRTEFGLTLPDVNPEIVVDEYLSSVEQMSGLPDGWTVTSDTALDFFSYTRFQIYQDLDPTNWIPQINAGQGASGRLVGSESFAVEYAPPYDANSDLDQTAKAEDIIHVADADASQMVAVRRVLDGNDLIIQGPPGTGKSQTITNIIAACVAAGKRILFVSEKAAALEVVYSNLCKVGLGRLALELHSHRARKKDVLSELERTLRSRPKSDGERTQALHAMRRFKVGLQDYTESSTAVIEGFGINATTALDIHSDARDRLVDFQSPKPVRGEFAGFGPAKFADVESTVSDIQTLLAGDVGLPIDHPFWGTGLKTVTPDDEDRLRSHCSDVLGMLDDVGRIARKLTDATKGAVGNRLADLWLLAGHATAVNNKPVVSLWSFDPDLWDSSAEVRLTVLQTGRWVRQTFEELGDHLLPDAWARDCRQDYDNVGRHIGSIFRWFRPNYRRSLKELQSMFRGTPPRRVERILEFSELVINYQTLSDSINEAPEAVYKVFGESWKGVHSDFAELLDGLDTVDGVLTDVASDRVLPDALRFLSDRAAVKSAAKVARDLIPALEVAEVEIQGLYDALKLPPLDYDDVKSLIRPDLYNYVQVRHDQIHRLKGYVSYAKLRAALKVLGLHALAAAADTWPYAGERLVEFTRLSWAKDAYRVALLQFPDLQDFSRDLHEKTVDRFAKSDEAVIRENRHIVAREHTAGMPRYPAGQLGILLREFEKMRSHKPLRKLVAVAGGAIQRIKPVFMMSPLSVATYLPPQSIEFDLVIFDEASQIRPIDAFGAILRSKQVVVVGDKQQLPPTTFFVTDAYADELLNEAESVEESSMMDIESILGLAAARGCPSSMLSWHYRSRHQSLITISNRLFYDSRLQVFPSASAIRGDQGLQFRFVPGSVYVPGKNGRYNAGEAQAVARRALQHVRENPKQSLGIVSFGSGQRDRILAELEQLRRQSAEIDFFEKHHPDEPLFVKNLENVQGDERDVILVSIGYGKRSDGSLSHNFGPINSEGGGRRLNVVFTRARVQCVIFANFRHESLDLERARSTGVAILKEFMRYADSNVDVSDQVVVAGPTIPDGGTDQLSESQGPERRHDSLDGVAYNNSTQDESIRSAMVREIKRSLETRGYVVREGVGESEFRIDLAVHDPADSTHFALAVQTDGLDYHSTHWTRSRNRQRDAVLMRKGWRVHRVWAPDWYRDPAHEADRIEELLLRLGQSDSRNSEALRSDRLVDNEVYESSRDGSVGVSITTPYRVWVDDGSLRGAQLRDFEIGVIVSAIVAILAVESPIHVEEVVRRLRDASDSSRASNRVRDVVTAALEAAMLKRLIVADGSFVWGGTIKQSVEVRDRNALPDESRDIEYIHENEIATALDRVVLGTGGIRRDDAIREVRRMFGYLRSSREIDGRIDGVLSSMIEDKLIRCRDGLLSL